MNEHIKRCWVQAVNNDDTWEGQVKFLEKFAEGIVQECCDKIEREYKYALGEKTQWLMAQDVQYLLRDHFGVEE